MTPVMGVFPVAFVAIVLFVVLLAAIVNGRLVSAILGFLGLLLVMGGLLLVGSWIYLRRPVAWEGLPRFEPNWAPFGEAPTERHRSVPQVTRREVTIARAKQLLAERPEQSDDAHLTSRKEPSSTDASGLTDEPPGPPRPAWMDAPMGRVDGLYRTTVTIGPWMNRQECEEELAAALRNAVATYAERHLGDGKGKDVHLPLSYIHENIVRGEWEERRQDTIHTMVTLHELLEFDRDANRTIEASYRNSVVGSRLGYLSAGAGALLGLLTIVFGYLKLDTLTRGYYTGRLRLTAGAAILALAVIAGLLVTP